MGEHTARVGIYARLSFDRTGESTSTQRQLDDCHKMAELRGWEVVDTYVDSEASASKRITRPEYERMLADIDTGRIDGVLTWKLDRLVRRPAEFERFWTHLEDRGQLLASFKESFDTSTEWGLAMVRILVIFAGMEAANISTRVQRKHEESAQAGRWVGGQVPYGYRRAGGTIEPDPHEAPVVAEIASRLLAGDSCSSITRDLNARGVPTKQGAEWGRSTVRTVILRPTHAGLRLHGGTYYPGDWEAILDRADWERVRDILTDRRTRLFYNAPQQPLTGLLYCGRCGRKMRGKRIRSKPAYRCSVGDGEGDYGCGVSVTAEPLEGVIREAVLVGLQSPAILSAWADGAEDRDGALLRQIRDDEEALERLARDFYVDRSLPEGVFLKMRDELEASIESSRQALRKGSQERMAADMPDDYEALRRLWDEGSPAYRRAMAALVLRRIVVHPQGKGGCKFDSGRIELIRREAAVTEEVGGTGDD